MTIEHVSETLKVHSFRGKEALSQAWRLEVVVSGASPVCSDVDGHLEQQVSGSRSSAVRGNVAASVGADRTLTVQGRQQVAVIGSHSLRGDVIAYASHTKHGRPYAHCVLYLGEDKIGCHTKSRWGVSWSKVNPGEFGLVSFLRITY